MLAAFLVFSRLSFTNLEAVGAREVCFYESSMVRECGLTSSCLCWSDVEEEGAGELSWRLVQPC